MSFFKINNLTYKDYFKDFNLEIEKGKFISIIAPNHSGKTILTKIISAIIPTTDVCSLNDISLNRNTVLSYISKLGVVTNDFNQDFLFKKVKDELAYPLLNLGYTEHKINQKINIVSKFFKIENILNKNINDLNISTKKKLLIIISLIHEPELLILDDAFLEMDKKDLEFMLKRIKNLTKKGLTVLNITSSLETIIESDKVYVLNNFQIEKEFDEEIDYDYLSEIGIDLPFMIELSRKLEYLKLIDKVYFNVEELVGELWK